MEQEKSIKCKQKIKVGNVENMKRILITGANSYIGTSFEKWVKKNEKGIQTDTVDMIGDEWRNKKFAGYDAVFHVAGIAHADVGKVSEEQKALYYRVNSGLTSECAAKAKAEGVRQFIFMSSIIVYGEGAGIGKQKVINVNTPLAPVNFYGDSKVKAEEALMKLSDKNFKVVILRPPMIYGKGSKGNYPLLAKFARIFPIFPNIKNERSMLYIGNLCKFISLMIENEEQGIFFPQNEEYVQTCRMVELIAAEAGKKIYLTKFLNPFILLLSKLPGKIGGMANKAFGNMVYEKKMSDYKQKYCLYELQETIQMTEGSEI